MLGGTHYTAYRPHISSIEAIFIASSQNRPHRTEVATRESKTKIAEVKGFIVVFGSILVARSGVFCSIARCCSVKSRVQCSEAWLAHSHSGNNIAVSTVVHHSPIA